MKFALVIIENERSRRSVATDRAKHNESLRAWMAEQGRAGKLVGGEAFETDETGPVTVRFDADVSTTVTEEPFVQGSETLGGFVVVEVADRDEAVELAKSWPTGETIEVRPLWSAE